MKRQMTIEQRLREYAAWLRHPRLEIGCGSIFGRIQDEQMNAGAGGDETRPDIVDGVSCRPDGGLSRLAEQMSRDLRRDMCCRDIHALVQHLPEHHRRTLAAIYDSSEPRSVRAAAEALGVSRGQYCERKAALMAWFEGAMWREAA
ncbi:MAG: hypothetical protein P4L83_00370 [Nevskia sp.]|nr:hypothetical protein [Nevskia sp.]